MKKTASILDYSYPFLDPAIWDPDMKLHTYQKDFILRLIDKMYANYKLKQPETWVEDIQIIGSLTTSKWLFNSDLDVHLKVNLAKFIELNMPGADPKMAFDYLDGTRKEFDRAKILAPMTQHPIEYYFEIPEFVATNTTYVGVYSILHDKWLKDPVLFDADLDFEESKKQVMADAEAIAQQFEGSFGKIDRQIKRIDELETMINAWGPEKQQLFYNKIEEKLKMIEAEITKDLELRQQLIDARHEAQDPMADIEIKFKWLQRFGFFGILNNLKVLLRQTDGKITTTELPLIQKIVTKEAFLKEALSNHDKVIFVDFDDTIAKENEDHSIGELLPGAKETIKKLREQGFEVIIDSARANEEKGRKEIKKYLKKNDVEIDGFYEGEKPLAFRYIDDRAIEFNGTWDGILEKIDKAKKNASLRITSKLNQKYWIDPSGKEFPVDQYEGHYGWVLKNIFKGDLEKHPGGPPDEVIDKADEMIQQGWTRVTTESDYDFAMEIADLKRIPGYLDNFVAKHYTGGGVEIDDLTGEYQDLQDPFPSLQKAIQQARRLRRQPVAKQASVEQVETSDGAIIPVLVNPSVDELLGLENRAESHSLRGLIDPNTGDLYAWEAYKSIHTPMIFALGLDMDYNAYNGIASKNILHFSGNSVLRMLDFQKEVRDELTQKAASLRPFSKIAGILTDEGYWVDPNGTMHEVRDSSDKTHSQWTREHEQELLQRYPNMPHENMYDAYDFLLQNGWVRIGDSWGSDYGIQTADPFHIPQVVIDWIWDTFPEGAITIDDFNTKESRTIKLPVDNIQDAINQEFRRKAANLKQAQTKKVKQGDYSCVMALVPHELAQEIVEWGVRNVPDDKVYLSDGGKLGRELESHVTIKYGLLTNDAKKVRRSFNDDKPYKAKLGKVRHFQPPELPFDVLTVEVISDDLTAANKRITDSFDCATDLPSDEYKPHITISYMKRDTAKDYIGADVFEGKEIELDTVIFSPHKGNRTYFSVSHDKESIWEFVQTKTADFLPSLFNAPDNDWQFQEGGPDKEIALNPDSVSDETTWYAPCTEGKPRTKEVWRQFMSIFKKPFSKKEDMKVEAADEQLVDIGNITLRGKKTHVIKVQVPQALLDQYFSSVIDMKKLFKVKPQTANENKRRLAELDKLDRARTKIHDSLIEFAFNNLFKDKNWKDFPGVSTDIRYKISEFVEAMVPQDELSLESAYDADLAKKEKDSLGEDQTLLEYMKDMPDPTKKDFPHNTTWDPIYQDGEPSKPGMPVTYSPQISNEDNLDQNGPGGFPNRFIGKPKGEWTSNQGETNNAIIQMLKRREAALDILTKDITKEAYLEHAYWIDPNGKVFEVRGNANAENIDYSHYEWIKDNWKMLKKDYKIDIENLDSMDMVGGLVELGWTRIGDSSGTDNWQVQVANLQAIPKGVDNVLAQFATDGAQIDFADSNDNFVTLEWPWKNAQGAINRALRQNLPMAASLKQAGEQSASVPDYLMDEWKTEQINDDTDEAPYINHDQRDYPFGMHDSPENTGTGIGWPKDNEPYVVRLDILENPAYRLDPFGIGEYNVTWYESLPASDGIEKTNP